MIVNLPSAWTEKPGSGAEKAGCRLWLQQFSFLLLVDWLLPAGSCTDLESPLPCVGPYSALPPRPAPRSPAPRPAASLPFFGVQPCLCDDKGNELKGVPRLRLPAPALRARLRLPFGRSGWHAADSAAPRRRSD